VEVIASVVQGQGQQPGEARRPQEERLPQVGVAGTLGERAAGQEIDGAVPLGAPVALHPACQAPDRVEGQREPGPGAAQNLQLLHGAFTHRARPRSSVRPRAGAPRRLGIPPGIVDRTTGSVNRVAPS
jgi:hypothetical protein